MKRSTMLIGAILAAASPAAADPAPSAPTFGNHDATRDDVDRETGASSGSRTILPVDAILFGFDSTTLDTVDREQARAAARWLAENPDHLIVLSGHTDAVGSADYNFDLSRRRAIAVRDAMVNAGADPSRIALAPQGEEHPRSTDDSNNRQVTLYAERK
jgi:outer membrane protein OmpA-like peptidoglycan-associated protein